MGGIRIIKKNPLFTPEIDKLIIEGFLGNQRAMFFELRQEGFSRLEVVHRAAKLGLTKQFIQQCNENGVILTIRECLGCNKSFVSTGVHNRLCRGCQTRG
ncbi:MAG: hypothetical protein JRJ19_03340 [Deltaproteobacteria bacterium]|nr:hypothetical protein [Deltaproteobacteria bacterium]